MKIIIAGDGKVGLTLTQKLSAAGHDLTLIDSNQRVLDSSVERYDVMGVQGNCASMRVLESADVKKADLLIAATSSDEVNLLCGMTAHGLIREFTPLQESVIPNTASRFLPCGMSIPFRLW